MLAMDVSTSMLAKDLSPNRIEAAKNVATEFISGRPDDNIGLTIFAGESFTQCPMTTDHQTLINMLQNVRTDIAARGLIEDGTAVGMGLANAVGRLEKSKTKSKIVILLTDGSNNRGDISPITAADIAKSLGIRVYTIGVGTNDIAYYPMTVGGIVQDVKVPVEIDEETLRDLIVLGKKLAGIMKERLGCDGVNLIENNGEAAGQTVPHFHLHVIPRYADDGQDILWKPGISDPAVQEELVKKLSF